MAQRPDDNRGGNHSRTVAETTPSRTKHHSRWSRVGQRLGDSADSICASVDPGDVFEDALGGGYYAENGGVGFASTSKPSGTLSGVSDARIWTPLGLMAATQTSMPS